MANLTDAERDLLKWLGQEDFSQYGECHGAALDALCRLGLAQVHDDGGEKGSFIAKGRGPMLNSVSLTPAGIEALVAMRKERSDA